MWLKQEAEAPSLPAQNPLPMPAIERPAAVPVNPFGVNPDSNVTPLAEKVLQVHV
jgi:hypothetical protein